MWWISVWLILYACSMLWLVFGIQRMRISSSPKKTIDLSQLTIIIPFRNEEKNLLHFLRCVQSQTEQPVEWIFVNDHSTDASMNCFDSFIHKNSHTIELAENQCGKKQAIRNAMQQCSTDYCITMDADVIFGENYIENCAKIPAVELAILPVQMTSTNWWQSFFTLEYRFTTLLNKGVSGWLRPVNASGANLLIHLPTFREIDDFEYHKEILSGDDMYTLRAFRNHSKKIEIIENDDLIVKTATPLRFIEVMQQRIRWLGKTGNVNDSLNNLLGYWAVGLHWCYFALILFFSSSTAFEYAFLLFGFKFMVDFMLVKSDKSPNSLMEIVVGLLLFELFYPFYTLFLLSNLLISTTSWKGREL